jgi:hypothetical protein
MPTTDQITSSAEIRASDSPVSANSSAYSGYSGTISASSVHPTMSRARGRAAGGRGRQPKRMEQG